MTFKLATYYAEKVLIYEPDNSYCEIAKEFLKNPSSFAEKYKRYISRQDYENCRLLAETEERN